jgi:hypothetical protein
MNKLTNNSCKLIYDLASWYWKNNKFHPDLTKDDFQQECALAVLELLESRPELVEDQGYIKSAVFYVAKKYRLSVYNKEVARTKVWKKYRNEFGTDFIESYAEVTEHIDTAEGKLLVEDVIKVGKKVLKPLEFSVLCDVLKEKPYKKMLEDLGISDTTLRSMVRKISLKLKKAGAI